MLFAEKSFPSQFHFLVQPHRAPDSIFGKTILLSSFKTSHKILYYRGAVFLTHFAASDGVIVDAVVVGVVVVTVVEGGGTRTSYGDRSIAFVSGHVVVAADADVVFADDVVEAAIVGVVDDVEGGGSSASYFGCSFAVVIVVFVFVDCCC